MAGHEPTRLFPSFATRFLSYYEATGDTGEQVGWFERLTYSLVLATSKPAEYEVPKLRPARPWFVRQEQRSNPPSQAAAKQPAPLPRKAELALPAAQRISVIHVDVKPRPRRLVLHEISEALQRQSDSVSATACAIEPSAPRKDGSAL